MGGSSSDNDKTVFIANHHYSDSWGETTSLALGAYATLRDAIRETTKEMEDLTHDEYFLLLLDDRLVLYTNGEDMRLDDKLNILDDKGKPKNKYKVGGIYSIKEIPLGNFPDGFDVSGHYKSIGISALSSSSPSAEVYSDDQYLQLVGEELAKCIAEKVAEDKARNETRKARRERIEALNREVHKKDVKIWKGLELFLYLTIFLYLIPKLQPDAHNFIFGDVKVTTAWLLGLCFVVVVWLMTWPQT
jgi:hypothetical protein